MLSAAKLLIALVAVVGDGFHAMAGACGPPNQCYQSLSMDPIGAKPYCSSILTSPKTTITTTLSPATGGSTSTIRETYTVTETVTTRTQTLDGPTDLETSTSTTSVTELIESTVTSEATATTLVILTSPVVQTSIAIGTVDTTVYIYQTSTTVILTSITTVATLTAGDYVATETKYLATQTDVVVTLVPREGAQSGPVPKPTYLSTCNARVVYQACQRLYPRSISTVVEAITPSAFSSNAVVTKTEIVTVSNGAEATFSGQRNTRTVVVPGTQTIYKTELQTKYVTQVVPHTSVASPTELVVLESTLTNAETQTTYSPTVTEYSTQIITSVYTDDLDSIVKTITLSTLTKTIVATSHTAVPTFLGNTGFDKEPPTTGPWEEYNAGTPAPIILTTSSQAGPYALEIQFSRLNDGFHYSGYIYQPFVPADALIPGQLYKFSAYLRVSGSAKPRNDGCSVAYLYCAFGRDKYTNGNTYSRYDDTSVMVNQWFKAERTCVFTASQISNPYGVGVVIGFTCGNARGYIDSVSFAPV